MDQPPRPGGDGENHQAGQVGEALWGVDRQDGQLNREPDEQDQQRGPADQELLPGPPEPEDTGGGEIGPGQVLAQEPAQGADHMESPRRYADLQSIGAPNLEQDDERREHRQGGAGAQHPAARDLRPPAGGLVFRGGVHEIRDDGNGGCLRFP